MLLRLAILALLLLTAGLGVREHWDSAEVRGPLVAQDMLATGRWRPPYLLNEPYWNKPPLFHALVAASFSLFRSESEWVSRVPVVLAAIAVLLLVAATARRLDGPGTGWWAGLCLLGSLLFTSLARSCEMEMQLALTTAMVAYVLTREAEGGPPSLLLWLLATLSGAVSVLTKGPALALLFPLLLVASFAVVHRRPRLLLGAAALGSVLGVVIATLAYYGPAWSDPATQDELWARLSFGNVLHRRPWFYYAYQLPLAMTPAVLLTPWLWKHARAAPRSLIAPGLAALIGVAIFSCSASKQTHYLLPFLPWIAPLLGFAASRISARRWLALVAVVALVGLLGAELLLAVQRNERESPKSALLAFRTHTDQQPLATLDLSPSVVFYLARPDLVLIRNGYEHARTWLAAHPTGHLLVGIDRKTPFPAALLGAPLAVRWDSQNGRNALVLLGPGLSK